MNQVMGEVLPLALAVLISPLPIAAEILLLFSTRPKPNAAAYFIGFLLGVGIGLAVLTVLAAATGIGEGGETASWTSWLRIALGAALVLGGVRRLRRRPGTGQAETPGWMSGIEEFEPGRSLVVGLGIGALNPKNVVVGIAAGVTIAGGPISTGGQVVVIAAYALLASLGVLIPLATAIAMGARADSTLESWRLWLTDNNAAVVAVIFFLIGAVLVGKGVASL